MHPYEQRPAAAFWQSAVAQRHPLDITGLWVPKWTIARDHRFITLGSCFAQHIGRALRSAGHAWIDAEPAPLPMSELDQRRFNYGVFSCRTGNIYTVAALHQWLRWALGADEPSREVWADNGRYYDPFRPLIEPEGFSSPAELFASREVTLDALRTAVSFADVLVFTLGLTEGWINRSDSCVYPACPGTIAGRFDPALHEFRNFQYIEIRSELDAAFNFLRSHNPTIRFVLSVSPVPLTATASTDHILVSSTYSKSTLRAVAGDMTSREDTDYFPAYDIISGFPFRGMFYEPNLRSVSRHGVDFVMRSFFTGLEASVRPVTKTETAAVRVRLGTNDGDEVACEEMLLDAFRPTVP